MTTLFLGLAPRFLARLLLASPITTCSSVTYLSDNDVIISIDVQLSPVLLKRHDERDSNMRCVDLGEMHRRLLAAIALASHPTAVFQGRTMSAVPSFEEYLQQRLQDEAAAGASDVPDDIISDAPTAVQDDVRTAAANASPRSTHDIGRLLLQRAIQTQLYYLADLRDEPTYKWLRGFLGHDHLDDRGRFNELDGLCVEGAGWRGYLPRLEEAPPLTITVQLAPPRLSAQQRRNPYLAAQASEGRSYEETIDPRTISQTLRAVARSLGQEWAEDLKELAAKDRTRLALHVDATREGAVVPPKLQTKKDAERAFYLERQVVAGGEGDDQGTPLHKLNARLVARFCTRAALRRAVEELQGDDGGEAQRDAGKYLLSFSNEWAPRLKRGPDDDVRRSLGTPPPGQWQRLCDGADADDATEALWQELPQSFACEGTGAMGQYGPEALAARVRRARVDICEEVADELATVLANEFG
ncbi:hypothetical protein ACHAXT_011724 [Thalassiosira profunda]